MMNNGNGVQIGADDFEEIGILDHGGNGYSFEIETAHTEPTAKWYHAAFHTVCAVVGAGVLGLPYAFSYLGMLGGLITLSTLMASSIYTSYLLANLHEDENTGKRRNTYRELGAAIWGNTGHIIITVVQYTLCIGLCITYSVTAGQSLKGVFNAECDGIECEAGLVPYIVVFAVSQLFLSQLPNFHSLWWVSLLGGLMSIGYCGIAAIASLASIGNDTSGPTEEQDSSADTAFGVLNALGSIAFAFGGQAVLPEIQATLARERNLPSISSTTYSDGIAHNGRGALGTYKKNSTAYNMMKGVWVAYIVVIVTYFSVAIAGYAAFGEAVRPDVLLSISHPVALIDAANLMVVVHVAAGYQIFAQPVFEALEDGITHKLSTPPKPWVLRLITRTLFVFFTTFIASLVPFFSDLMGIIASIGLMPITFIFPPLLWIAYKRPSGAELGICVAIAVGTSLIAVLAFIGSMRNIVVDSREYDAFG